MIDEKLRTTFEQLGERSPPVDGIEHVLLFDALPGKATASGAELVAQLAELFFAREKRFAFLQPRVVVDDFSSLQAMGGPFFLF